MADPSLALAADLVQNLHALTTQPTWGPAKLNAFYDQSISMLTLIHRNPLLTQHPNFPAFRDYLAYYFSRATSDVNNRRSLTTALGVQWNAPGFPPPPPLDWSTSPAPGPVKTSSTSAAAKKGRGPVPAPVARMSANTSSSKAAASSSRQKVPPARERASGRPEPYAMDDVLSVGRRTVAAGPSLSASGASSAKRKSSHDTGFLGVQPPPLKKVKIEPIPTSKGKARADPCSAQVSQCRSRPSLKPSQEILDVDEFDPHHDDSSASSEDDSSDAEDPQYSREQLLAAKQAADYSDNQHAMAEVLHRLVPPSELFTSRADVKLLRRVDVPGTKPPNFLPCGRCIARGVPQECQPHATRPGNKCAPCSKASQACSWSPSARPPKVSLAQVKEMEFFTSQTASVNNTNRAFHTLHVEYALYEEMRRLCEFQALKLDAAQITARRSLLKTSPPASWFDAARDRGTSAGTVSFPVVDPKKFVTPSADTLPSSSSSAALSVAVLPLSGSGSQIDDDASVAQGLEDVVHDGEAPPDDEEEGEASVDAQDAPPVA
ncbi:hypothetical protein DFP72DRAFT_1058443 [Ephemerocybe angulata]|uniref:Uncharacterized protein n=1 Tax=Ephemerocybe angulata TaxID=980116 RepID=A0A8H6MH31_9AGAR|nr:hypothetical protein DFP72DRAFT_1058443 [Tulosesus angulatus]